jgi:hypothetical protein
MATCLLIVCSSSQVAAAETAPMSIFSAYWASKGFMDLMQMTAVPSTSSGATTSTASSSPTPCKSVPWVSLQRTRICLLDFSRQNLGPTCE